jgi:signal transduction histidine kinase
MVATHREVGTESGVPADSSQCHRQAPSVDASSVEVGRLDSAVTERTFVTDGGEAARAGQPSTSGQVLDDPTEIGRLLLDAGVRVTSSESLERPEEARQVEVRAGVVHHELVLRLPAGTRGVGLTVDLTGATRRRPDGAPTGAATEGLAGRNAELTSDNAALVALNADLRRSNRDLGEFAAIASHDLAEPLRVISGYVDLLARRYGDRLDDKARRWIDWTVDGVERMEALIAGLLTVSRLDSDAAPHGPVVLHALAADAVERHTSPHGAQLHVEVAPLPEVVGDAAQLRQLVDNLVANAVKFRRPGAPAAVRISAVASGGRCELTVDDDGIGIRAEHRDRVRRMFQRLHTHDEIPGTGVGLALVERIAERHGGALRIEDSPLGGTRFVVDLPLAVAGPDHRTDIGAGSRR